MTPHALRALQDIMFRTCVRNMMLLAALPYHLVEGPDATHARGLAHGEREQLRRANRVDDVRWLR